MISVVCPPVLVSHIRFFFCFFNPRLHEQLSQSEPQGQERGFISGFGSENVQTDWREGGTLTAWTLVILVIREEIVQSLFAGVSVFLLLRENRTQSEEPHAKKTITCFLSNQLMLTSGEELWM